MDFLQVLLLGIVVAVWGLIYFIWREVDIYIIEQDGGAPPQTLFEILERKKAMRILPLQEAVRYDNHIRNSKPHGQGGTL